MTSPQGSAAREMMTLLRGLCTETQLRSCDVLELAKGAALLLDAGKALEPSIGSSGKLSDDPEVLKVRISNLEFRNSSLLEQNRVLTERRNAFFLDLTTTLDLLVVNYAEALAAIKKKISTGSAGSAALGTTTTVDGASAGGSAGAEVGRPEAEPVETLVIGGLYRIDKIANEDKIPAHLEGEVVIAVSGEVPLEPGEITAQRGGSGFFVARANEGRTLVLGVTLVSEPLQEAPAPPPPVAPPVAREDDDIPF